MFHGSVLFKTLRLPTTHRDNTPVACQHIPEALSQSKHVDLRRTTIDLEPASNHVVSKSYNAAVSRVEFHVESGPGTCKSKHSGHQPCAKCCQQLLLLRTLEPKPLRFRQSLQALLRHTYAGCDSVLQHRPTAELLELLFWRAFVSPSFNDNSCTAEKHKLLNPFIRENRSCTVDHHWNFQNRPGLVCMDPL